MTIPPEAPGPARSSLDRLLGWVLMTVGALMATLCGLCSGGVVINLVAPQIGNIGTDAFLFFAILIFGIAPMMVGVLIFQAGRRMAGGSSKILDASTPDKPL